MCGLFDQQNLGTGFSGCQGRLDTCNAAADNDNIVERIEMFIAVRIARLGVRCFAQASGMPDERFIHMLPQRARMNEHLVIKARRQEARQRVVDFADVELKAGPVVLGRRRQTVKQFGRRRALVRFVGVALAQIDQCVRFFRAAGDGTTRTVIFETPPHQHLVVCQKR